jgi:hypothetical protein
MLKNFTNRFRGQGSSKTNAGPPRSETTDEAIAGLISEYFHGASTTAGYSVSHKSELIGDLQGTIDEIRSADKPVALLRGQIANWVVQHADFQVLCLTEPELEKAFYRGCPYVSGELYGRIRRLAPYNKDLKTYLASHEDVADSVLINMCRSRSTLALLYCNAFNYMRWELQDIPGSKDWFYAFMEAMLIWREDHYRREAGIPTFIDNIRAMELGVYMNVVTNPINVNPRYKWETTFAKSGQVSNYIPGTVSDPMGAE